MPATSWKTGPELKIKKKKTGGAKPLTPKGMKHVQTVKSFDGPGSRTSCNICLEPIRVEVRMFTNGKKFNILNAVGGGYHRHQDG